MEGHLVMSEKERRRTSLFDEVLAGRMTLRQASGHLTLSYRQCRRSYKRFREEGDAGLLHRSRGKPSNRGYPASLRRNVLARYESRYAAAGLGPTLAAEKLAEDGFEMDHETLRRWLLAEGLWTKRRKRKQHRTRRERKQHFGELVQMDGSPHAWFGSERPRACLMNMVDDATGATLSMMDQEETTEVSMRLLWRWIERYGIPQALYTDKKSVFVTLREPTLDEQLSGETPKTAFGKACAKLGIEIIAANSPQAKGRVERNHGVYQDRFVKELVLQRITTIDTANRLLGNGFTDTLNKKFALPPISDVDFHRPVPKGLKLEDIFCVEYDRVVKNDWTIRHDNQYYQIEKNSSRLPRPKDKVVVRIRLDGTRQLLFKDTPLRHRALTNTELKSRSDVNKPSDDETTATSKKIKSGSPRPHPWRKRGVPLAADSSRK